ncbi:MAG TPA: hypothetical protein VJP80_04890 [Candidatus Saccharimonadales bacterium]|nr:hypothetical protein [Candidatus Saccharimonadales bacterium]
MEINRRCTECPKLAEAPPEIIDGVEIVSVGYEENDCPFGNPPEVGSYAATSTEIAPDRYAHPTRLVCPEDLPDFAVDGLLLVRDFVEEVWRRGPVIEADEAALVMYVDTPPLPELPEA